MPTAKPLRIVDGIYPSPATVYEVDPPIAGSTYVAVFYAPPVTAGHAGRIVVLRSTANGGSFTGEIDPTDGTHATSNPDEGPELALELAGRTLGVGPYEIVEGDPPADPTEILAAAEAGAAEK